MGRRFSFGRNRIVAQHIGICQINIISFLDHRCSQIYLFLITLFLISDFLSFLLGRFFSLIKYTINSNYNALTTSKLPNSATTSLHHQQHLAATSLNYIGTAQQHASSQIYHPKKLCSWYRITSSRPQPKKQTSHHSHLLSHRPLLNTLQLPDFLCQFADNKWLFGEIVGKWE